MSVIPSENNFVVGCNFFAVILQHCTWGAVGKKNNQSYSLSWIIVTTYVTHNHKMFSNKNCFVVSCENNIIIHTNSFLHSDLRRWHFLWARVDGPQAEAALQHVKEWRIKSTLSFIKSAPLGPWLNFLGDNWRLSVKCTSKEFIDLGQLCKTMICWKWKIERLSIYFPLMQRVSIVADRMAQQNLAPGFLLQECQAGHLPDNDHT